MAAQPSKHVVIVGGSFAGLTAAYELKRDLGDRVRVTLIDRSDRFVFIPSLIWVPFGWRTPEQISFPLQQACERKGIEFRKAVATAIDAASQEVEVGDVGAAGRRERLRYDYLLVATGPHVEFEAVPGVGPHGGYTESICTAEHAVRAGQAWAAFLKNPGPVIVGATQGSSCYGAAYEFVFNLEYALRRAKVRDKVSVTYVTSEPFPGHFGIGGQKHAQGMTEWFFRHVKIDWVINAVLDKVTPGEVHFRAGQFHSATDKTRAEDLAGRSLPFKYAMLIPPFLGAKVVRKSGLGNGRGFVVTDDYFRHPDHPTVFAAGVAVAVAPPAPCQAGCSVPKTGYISEVMAHTAAKNIAASIEGKPLTPKPQADIDAKCILDAGNQGIIMYTDRVYAPNRRRWQTLIPGPWAHWAKLAFERYFLWKMRSGRVNWP
ncbi:MAG: FAD-dependent oxidoreductase [Gemmataceae bacterium]